MHLFDSPLCTASLHRICGETKGDTRTLPRLRFRTSAMVVALCTSGLHPSAFALRFSTSRSGAHQWSHKSANVPMHASWWGTIVESDGRSITLCGLISPHCTRSPKCREAIGLKNALVPRMHVASCDTVNKVLATLLALTVAHCPNPVCLLPITWSPGRCHKLVRQCTMN